MSNEYVEVDQELTTVEARQLIEITQLGWRALSKSEFMAIIHIFKTAIERI